MYENLNRSIKDENEKQMLMKQLLSKQQEKNEKLINDQTKMIDSLNFKCKRLEAEIKKLNENQNGNNHSCFCYYTM